MILSIRPETKHDSNQVRTVNQLAFGSSVEADLVDAIRSQSLAEVSLVAEMGQQVVGHILFSPITIDSEHGPIAALSLAPMAVHPDFQNRGIGSKLVYGGLAQCRSRPFKLVAVLGHPSFYPRFGFDANQARELLCPFGGGEAWMTLNLEPGDKETYRGQVAYSKPFSMFA